MPMSQSDLKQLAEWVVKSQQVGQLELAPAACRGWCNFTNEEQLHD